MVGVRIKNQRDAVDFLGKLRELDDFSAWPESKKQRFLKKHPEGVSSLRITLELNHLSKFDDVEGATKWIDDHADATLEHNQICALMRLVSESSVENKPYLEKLLAKAEEMKKNEGIYSLGIRGYSNWKDHNKVLDMLTAMKRAGFRPRLRTFTPVISCLASNCSLDEIQKLEDVFNEMVSVLRKTNIDLTQIEYLAMFSGLLRLDKLCDDLPAENENSKRQRATVQELFIKVLCSFGGEDIIPNEDISQVLEKWFLRKGYKCKKNISIPPNGSCSFSGVRLHQKRLSTENESVLKKKIDELVGKRKALVGQWEGFKQFIAAKIARRGREDFDVVVDAANVAYFKQNTRGARFKFYSIYQMTKELDRLGLRWLLVMHTSHKTNQDIRNPRDRELLQKWEREKKLLLVPRNHNDDWYWLYTAIYRGKGTLILSNDEMRDHHFMMLQQNMFRGWKRNHQIFFGSRYNKNADRLEDIELKFPSRYTLNAQLNFENSDDVKFEQFTETEEQKQVVKRKGDNRSHGKSAKHLKKTDGRHKETGSSSRESASSSMKQGEMLENASPDDNNTIAYTQGGYVYRPGLVLKSVHIPKSLDSALVDALPGHHKKYTTKGPRVDKVSWTCFIKEDVNSSE